jgi:CheY-like chemotaxis protein
LKILVVDDNEDAAEMLAGLLIRWGHAARTAFSGEAALAEAAAFGPDVVLLDINLPDADGYQVARRFRQDARLAGARLVALTGYGQEEDRRRAAEAGFDIHLTKPAEPAALRRALEDLPRSPA